MPKHDGHHWTVDVLLAAGADPMMQGSYWGISATTLCATDDSREFLPALLTWTPKPRDIFHACVLAEPARVKALLKKDSSTASKPDAGTRIWTSEHGWTPLMYCAKARVGATDKKKAAALAEIAHLLIASGASPDGCVDMAMENLAVLRAMPDAGAK